MAGRIRSIKPEVLDDEVALELSDAAWRLWVSSWVIADDHGRLRASPKYLAAEVWKDTRRTETAQEAVDELVRAGLGRRYHVEGQLYFELKPAGWRRHQRIDKPGKERVPVPMEEDFLDPDKRKSRAGRPRKQPIIAASDVNDSANIDAVPRNLPDTPGNSAPLLESPGTVAASQDSLEEPRNSWDTLAPRARARDLRPPISDQRPPISEREREGDPETTQPHTPEVTEGLLGEDPRVPIIAAEILSQGGLNLIHYDAKHVAEFVIGSDLAAGPTAEEVVEMLRRRCVELTPGMTEDAVRKRISWWIKDLQNDKRAARNRGDAYVGDPPRKERPLPATHAGLKRPPDTLPLLVPKIPIPPEKLMTLEQALGRVNNILFDREVRKADPPEAPEAVASTSELPTTEATNDEIADGIDDASDQEVPIAVTEA